MADPVCVVLGIGNPGRGDDAVGLVVARALRGRVAGTRVIESGGEATALLDLMHGTDAVWLVDAARSGAAPGTVHRIDCAVGESLPAAGPVSSHGFGLAAALALARTLGVLPPRCVVYAIEAADFTPGGVLSPAVAASAVRVVARLLAELPQSAKLHGSERGTATMTDDPVGKGAAIAQRLREQGHDEHAEHLTRVLRGGAVGEALLFSLREACQTVLTAVEAIDPTTETLLEDLRLEVDKRLQPRT